MHNVNVLSLTLDPQLFFFFFASKNYAISCGICSHGRAAGDTALTIKQLKWGSEHVAHSVGPLNFTHGNAAPFGAPAGA